MTENSNSPQLIDPSTVTSKWFRRLAILLLIMAFWPVVFGAITTTLNAGMAFLDWPSSDGQNMVTYPWLKDIGTDKFWEHGHRLGGMTIGILSIALVIGAWFADTRRWIFALALAILLGVIAQGVMGGVRVLRDNVYWAIVHGSFAPLVTSLIMVMVFVTGKRYWAVASQAPEAKIGKNLLLAYLTAGCLFIQYILGCFLRHRGTAVHEHLGFAAISTVLILITLFMAIRSNSKLIKGSGFHLFGVLLIQLLLGMGAWIVKFGLPSMIDYVPRAESPEQVFMRTAHTVMGMFLFMSAVVHVVKVKRISWLQKHPEAVGSSVGSDFQNPSTTKGSTI
ncbi:Heme A synthase [Polystyrenella longa]|uniref:Heme A synthase n=1 Tax=Polystyrenella longa TaxID=2528007 RepID=A0A518CHJ7_9PLAN|nr:COX15/CtaA family protein [Polystyrenella longa]QDU78702.1 Heme A synthase [Polystyrenella longa]